MNDDREVIISRVRGALAPLTKRAAYPSYPDDVAATPAAAAALSDPWKTFCERVKLVNGVGIERIEDVVAFLKANQWLHGYCDPVLWPKFSTAFGSEFKVETEYDRARIEDYQFGITRAAGAVAETGTLILWDGTTSRRLGALTPWVHVAVLERKDLIPTTAQAVASMGGDPNIIWATGPSKTADVEGILIEGVHGPGRQIALLV